MLTIDSQVHAYEANSPKRPWLSKPNWPASANADEMVAAMDAVGVDGAVNISPFSLYGYDASYALELYAKYPKRFALIKPVNIADPAVGDTITDWANTKGAVAVRIMMTSADFPKDPADAGITRVMKAAAKHNMPVNMLIWGRIEQAEQIVALNPDTSIIIDHLGVQQPRVPPAAKDAWAELPQVLKIAAHKNATIKVSGACTLSHEPFPFKDIWDPLARVFDAFGLDRCMWGTDWTRAKEVVDYKPAVDAFRVTDRLSDSDKAKLMGGSLTKIYKWTPSK
jgi:predicted TIM-barrel fold metal-dependent hydrolase